MTEREWLETTDPQPMLAWLRLSGKADNRKLRLFACACCYPVAHLVDDAPWRRALAAAEAAADGLLPTQELRAAWQEARDTPFRRGYPLPTQLTLSAAAESAHVVASRAAVRSAARAAAAFDWADPGGPGKSEAARVLPALLRDIHGNPFRPLPPLAPPLLDTNGGVIRRLAQAAYEERLMPSGHLDPARLAVLADALEEAGAPEEVVKHLRSDGSHVRGCAVLDAVLGRG